MLSERNVYVFEIDPGHRVRVLASGPVDAEMLDALAAYVDGARRRLGRHGDLPGRVDEPGGAPPQE